MQQPTRDQIRTAVTIINAALDIQPEHTKKASFLAMFDVMWDTLNLNEKKRDGARKGWWIALERYSESELKKGFIELMRNPPESFSPNPSAMLMYMKKTKTDEEEDRRREYGSDWEFLKMPPEDLQYKRNKLKTPQGIKRAEEILKKAGLNGFRRWEDSPGHKLVVKSLSALSSEKRIDDLSDNCGLIHIERGEV